MSEPLIKVGYDDRGDAGRVAWVTFNNPAKRNALGLEGKQLFIDTLTALKHDESLRALVLTGAGDRSFVGGTNLARRLDRRQVRHAGGTLRHSIRHGGERTAAPDRLG